jgi:hypothetical protein
VQENPISVTFQDEPLRTIGFVPIQGESPPKIIVESDKLSKFNVSVNATTDEIVVCGKFFEQIYFGCKV